MKYSLLRSSRASRTFHLHLYLALGLWLVTFLILQWFSQKPAIPPLQTRLQAFPLQVGTWKGTEGKLDSDVITALGLDDWLLRSYQDGSGAFIWLYIGFLGHVDFVKGKSPHSPQVCYPAQGWKPIQRGMQQLILPGGKSMLINTLLVQKGLERRLVLYWYQWGDQIVAEENWEDYRSKFYRLLHIPFTLIHNTRTDRALVRVSAPVVNSVEETLSHEIAFIQAVFPLLAQQFSLNGSSL